MYNLNKLTKSFWSKKAKRLAFSLFKCYTNNRIDIRLHPLWLGRNGEEEAGCELYKAESSRGA